MKENRRKELVKELEHMLKKRTIKEEDVIYYDTKSINSILHRTKKKQQEKERKIGNSLSATIKSLILGASITETKSKTFVVSNVEKLEDFMKKHKKLGNLYIEKKKIGIFERCERNSKEPLIEKNKRTILSYSELENKNEIIEIKIDKSMRSERLEYAMSNPTDEIAANMFKGRYFYLVYENDPISISLSEGERTGEGTLIGKEPLFIIGE